MKRAPRNRIWEVAIAAAAAWGWIGDSGTHINRGWANFERGRYRAAIADFDHALRLEPGAAYIYANRAGAKSSLGLYREAIADYDQALRLEPDHTVAYVSRGRAKSNLGAYEEAFADFDQALLLEARQRPYLH